jgi:hypothetical protein
MTALLPELVLAAACQLLGERRREATPAGAGAATT